MANLDDNDDYDFDDDELDALPQDTLLELERNAIQATQYKPSDASQAVHARHADNSTSRSQRFHEDLNLEEIVDETTGALFATPALGLNPLPRNWGNTRSIQTGTNGVTRQLSQPRRTQEQVDRQLRNDDQGSQYVQPAAQDLLARIHQLERDRIELRNSAQKAKEAEQSKAGEISIVRRNHDRLTREFEQRISNMERTHTETLEKLKLELDKARRERDKAETSNRFLEHDIVQGAKQSKKPAKSGDPAKRSRPSPNVTPRKNRTLPFRDGFDDDDIMLFSPSKRDRSKPSTPKAAGKRKRPTVEQSPGPPLPLSAPREVPVDQVRPDSDFALDPSILAKLDKNGEDLQILQLFLGHRVPGRKRTLEILSHYSFDSDPNRSMSSIILDDLPRLIGRDTNEDLTLNLCRSLLKLWEQCLEEKSFGPLSVLIAGIDSLLGNAFPEVSTTLIPRLVPLAISTADLVAIPNAMKSSNGRENPQVSTGTSSPTNADLCDIVNLLRMVALSCMDQDSLESFWQHMAFDFVLVALHQAQPMPCIITVLQLLSTSALPDSFGAIATASPGTMSTPEYQEYMETRTVDRLCTLLFDTLSLSKHSSLVLLELRENVIDVIVSFCGTTHAASALAAHPSFLFELPRFLYVTLDTLYSLEPRTTASAAASRLINLTMRSFWHLATRQYDGGASTAVTELRNRISSVPGAGHQLLVALTRIAFAQGVLLEEDLEVEVMDAAHAMLDEILNPEEGEAVVRVFRVGGVLGDAPTTAAATMSNEMDTT